MQFFTMIGSYIRQAVGLVLPVFAKAGDFRRWNPWVWRILHIVFLAAILVGMWWLNRYFQVGYFLQAVPFEYRQFFLPVLFLLLYVLSWLGWWLWRLLGEEEAAAEFPDINDAWDDAVAKLEYSGLGLADAPLFLVLGRPVAGDDALIEAAGVKTDIRAPGKVGSPLQIYANRDAIFVTCSGSSAWGRFATLLAGELDSLAPATPTPGPADKTVQFGEQLGLPQELLDEMRQLLTIREQRELSPAEADRLRVLAEMTKAPPPTKHAVTLGTEDAARGTARLAFLCRLIRRDRRPWCPVNGILVVVPWTATEADETAKNAATILQRDLTAVRTALQLRCPMFALVSDLETARGFGEFRRGFPPETLKARVGQRLPLVPDVPPSELPSLYERAVQWISHSVLPAGILRFLRYDGSADPRKPGGATAHNRNLYLLLREVATRGPRLARILSRGFAPVSESSVEDVALCGGCYLGGTGRQPDQQAFIHGVFQRLVENQSSVAWTSAALADDARYRRWAAVGFVGIAAVAVIGGLLAWWSGHRPA